MKNTYSLVLLLLLIAAACKTPVNIAEYRESAVAAEELNDYLLATDRWEYYFSQVSAENEPDGSVYAHAAQTAFEAARLGKSLEWFEKAAQKGYNEPPMHKTLALIHQYQGNVSKEISALEEYITRSEKADPDAYSRLFSIYYTTDQAEKAIEAWENIPDTEKRTEQNLDRYFTLNKQLKNDATADSVSMALLEIAPEHVGALEWQAQKKYNLGAARYKKEMDAYEARPTTGNYQTLLRGLKAASVHFREALQYFETLWEVNPDDRHRYAEYMNNIHVRFNDKQKADYYRKFIN